MTDFKLDYPNGAIVAIDQISVYVQCNLCRVWSLASYRAILDRVGSVVFESERISEFKFMGLQGQVICPNLYEDWNDPYNLISDFDFLHIAWFILNDTVIARLHGFRQAIINKKNSLSPPQTVGHRNIC